MELSLKHPISSQQRITDQLRLEGLLVSASSVCNSWIKEDMETQYKRLLRLEENASESSFELTEDHIRLFEKPNPCIRERHAESNYSGQLLCQDTF